MLGLGFGHKEPLGTHQLTQREIRFQRCAARSDADNGTSGGKQLCNPLDRRGAVERFKLLVSSLFGKWRAHATRTVDEFVPEPAAVAQKIAVDVLAKAVENTPQHARPLAGNGVASQAAVHAHRRR